jgi:putative tricarboxylic transport membrane protein
MQNYLPDFGMLWNSIGYCLSPLLLFQLTGSMVLGIIFGALPGLTATMGVALLTSLTYGLDTYNALAILIACFIGGIYGGSRSAILVNIPGTPAAAATALDGYPLALKGKAQFALSLATAASFWGTLFGLIILLFISPALSSVALKFGAHEFFLLSLFGVMICGSISSKDSIKGWIVGLFGLLIAQIGLDTIYAFPRYTFDNIQLNSGITLIPAMIGVFAIPEVICSLRDDEEGLTLGNVDSSFKTVIRTSLEAIRESKKHIGLTLRSGFIGTLIGALPGAGADIACWVAYDAEKRISKNGNKFGTGEIEGVLAPEVANNSMVGGAFVPMLTLAVPGDSVTAIILAALWLHGVRPGPLLMTEQPEIFYIIVALLFLGAIVMAITGQLLTPLLVKAVTIPKGQLMPIVVVLTVIGSYSINNRAFDVLVMLMFGIIGYFMRTHDYPAAPLTLGIILGPMADENLRRALMLGGGSLEPFITRPISMVFIIAILLMVVLEIRKAVKRKRAVLFEQIYEEE